MPNDENTPAGSDCQQRLVRYSITSCENCPFYAYKYCGLSQRLNAQYGTDFPTFVVNEWRQGISPSRCPLRNVDMLFYLANSQAQA